MGLDMYLTRRIYVGNKYKKPEEQVKVEGKDIEQAQVSEIIADLGYWRKANAIHNWFVQNVQEGEDDCKEYHVSREKLEELLLIVNTVLKASELVEGQIGNGKIYDKEKDDWVPKMVEGKTIKDPSKAQELLPTQSGFFFGSEGYDEYYYQDLLSTKDILVKALDAELNSEIYYQSSW
jgi:hypothetical protein